MKVGELIEQLQGIGDDDAEVGVFVFDKTLGVTHHEAIHSGNVHPALRRRT